MTIVAAIYLAALVGFIVGIAASPDHVFKGIPAALTFACLLLSGGVLAVSALG